MKRLRILREIRQPAVHEATLCKTLSRHFKWHWPGCLVWMRQHCLTETVDSSALGQGFNLKSEKQSLTQILSIWALEPTAREGVKYSKSTLSSSVSHLGWVVSLDCHHWNCLCLCFYYSSVITTCSFKIKPCMADDSATRVLPCD